MLRMSVIALTMILTAASASAQRAEVSGTVGRTFSEGVSGDPVLVPGVGTFDRIDPKDAWAWGVRVGFFVGENSEIGFLYDQQPTDLEGGGTTTAKLGDIKLHNYHGYYAFNFGSAEAIARPYLLFGVGGTQYGTVSVTATNVPREIPGETRFSWTGAAGLKIYPAKAFGIRLEGRWTPTYIKSEATGWWCDPFWGCYVVGNTQYANQFELAGGINFRFE